MEFAGENKWQWLRPYFITARWVGWLLICFGIADMVALHVNWSRNDPSRAEMWRQSWGILHMELMPGLLSLWIGQFLRWLTERETQGGWLLRQSSRLLWLATAVYLVQALLMIWRIPKMFEMSGGARDIGSLLSVISLVILPNLLMRLAPVIILFGMAEALRRMGPIVDESKSTV